MCAFRGAGWAGLVILAGGQLRAEHVSEKALLERNLPLLYAKFDGRLAYLHASYRCEGPVSLIHIERAAFEELDRLSAGLLRHVVDALSVVAAAQCHYDVFLSYTHEDLDLGRRFKQDLESAGLRVYMDEQRAPARFIPVVKAAILESLVLVALLTEHTARNPEGNWVQREINFRARTFDSEANIIPINLGGGQAPRIADGYASIDAAGHEAAAVEHIVGIARGLRSGERPWRVALARELPEL